MTFLRTARRAAKLTQKQVADSIGIASRTYFRYEAGVRLPDFNTASRLSEALDIPVDLFLAAGVEAPQQGRKADAVRKLKSMNEATGMTYREIFARCGIPKSSFSRYLNGVVAPPFTVAEKWAGVVGVDVGILTDLFYAEMHETRQPIGDLADGLRSVFGEPEPAETVETQTPGTARDGEKPCRRCGKAKPIESFRHYSPPRRGHQPTCRECNAERLGRTGERRCGTCKILLSADRKPYGSPGNNRNCEACREIQKRRQRIDLIAQKYAVDREEAARLADTAQCEACGLTKEVDGRAFSVDHCHASGKVRGVLCRACNTSLGCLGESITRMRQLARYIRRFQCTAVKQVNP